MKTKTQKPELIVSVPDGPIQYMEESWAEEWIHIYDNGGIGYKGCRKPTEEEKVDIMKRILKLQELLKERKEKLDKAFWLMKGNNS